MAENLNKIWAECQNMSDFYMEIFLPIRTRIESAVEDERADLDESASDVFSNMNRSMEWHMRESQARKEAIEQLRNTLVSEKARSLGWREQTSQIERIPPEFWIKCEIWPKDDVSYLGDVRYENIRILASLLVTTTKRGPKPKSEFRQMVIKECCSAEPSLISRSPDYRRQTYLRYIEKHHPEFDRRRDFSLSAFQQEEKILRENGII